nr:glycine-rich protein 5-like [Drosophila suzukii]
MVFRRTSSCVLRPRSIFYPPFSVSRHQSVSGVASPSFVRLSIGLSGDTLFSLTSKTATTAARIFSRLDSVEEVQRGRSGSAVGITPPGGPGAGVGVGGVGGSGLGGQQQQQFVGVGGGGVGVAGAGAAAVGGVAGAGAVRQRSASTVLDINLPQRKVSVGGGGIGIGLAGPPSPVIRNGFSVYDPPVSVISSRHSNFNGQGGVGGGGALTAGPAQQVGHSSHHHHHQQQQHHRRQEVEQEEGHPD